MSQHFPLRLLLMMVLGILVAGAVTAQAPDGETIRFQLKQDRVHGQVLEVTVPEASLEPLVIDGGKWAAVRIPGSANLMERGLPALPFAATELPLGDRDRAELELVSLVIRTIDLSTYGFAGVAPSKGHFTRDVDPATVPWVFDAKVYDRDVVFPEDKVWLGEPFIAGPRRGQAVRVPLARWSVELNQLEVVERTECYELARRLFLSCLLSADTTADFFWCEMAQSSNRTGCDISYAGCLINPFSS